jgi:flavin reductase (DIM6/NTAB) family NADH-FMN oxidoreductase RutF
MEVGLFRSACARFATGVAIVTASAADGAPHGLTINSFASLSLDPPLVMVAIDRRVAFLDVFEKHGAFAVNILGEHQCELSNRFASVLPEGRFEGVEWSRGVTGSPVLEGGIGVIECRIERVFDAGDHRVLVGLAVGAELGEGKPLVFFGSEYVRLA